MTFTDRLAFILTLDPNQAVNALGKVATAAKKGVDSAEGDLKRLQADLKKMEGQQVRLLAKGDAAGAEAVAGSISQLQGKLQGMAAPGGVAANVLGKIGLGGAAAGEGLSSAAVSAAGAGAALAAVGLSAKWVEKSVKDFGDLTAEVRAFQRTSGASATEASALTFALKRVGVDSDTGAKAMFMLGKNVEGSQDKLAKLGVQVAHDASGNVDLFETLKNVSDAYRGTQDQAQRNAIAAAAFGRSGLSLIPILGKTRGELDQLQALASKQGLIFSQEDLDSGKAMSLALKDVRTSVQGLEVDTAKAFVPIITDAAKAAAAVAPLAHQLHLVEGAVGGLVGGALGLVPVLGPLAALKIGHDAAKKSADDHAAAEEGAAGSLEDVATAADKANDALSKSNAALGAAQALQKADDELAKAQQAVADAADAEADKAKKVADARANQQRATDDLAEAEQRLKDAQRQAPEDITRAQIAAREADRKVAEAQKAADRARLRPAGDPHRQEAEDNLTTALLDQADAHDRLNKLEADRAHPKAVRDAEADVADKKAKAAEAQSKVDEANAIDPMKEQADAAERLRTAEIDRQQAIANLVGKLEEVNAKLLAGLDVTKLTRAQIDGIVTGLQQAVGLQAQVAAKEGNPGGQGLSLEPTPDFNRPATGPIIPGQPVLTGSGAVGPTASGTADQASVVNHTTNFGPITVVSPNPNDVLRAIDSQARIRRMGHSW